MTTTRILHADKLRGLLEAASRDYRLVAPVREDEMIDFRVVDSPEPIVAHTDYVNPRQSIKPFFFPRTEPLVTFDRTRDGLEVREPDTAFPRTLLFGCRPCDAASLLVMDPLYDWDYHDAFWFHRRRATTVVAVSCTRCDESCFCTALGGSPHGTDGADLLLTPLDEGRYLAEILTDKGQAVADLAPDAFTDGEGDKDAACREALDALPPPLDLDAVTEWLKTHFEDEHWAPWSYRCWGCGCCTFLCPTCHCFDIVDEGGYRHGQRRRNWDACQFALFTQHASGHNPRPHQAERWRQRVEHKFYYYVDKFHYRSCVGCGRCIRSCPVNMNIYEQLRAISDELSKEPAAAD